MANTSVAPHHQTVPPTPSIETLVKCPAEIIALAEGNKNNILQDSKKRKINSTSESADEREAKKAKVDNQLNEKASTNCAIPQQTVSRPIRRTILLADIRQVMEEPSASSLQAGPECKLPSASEDTATTVEARGVVVADEIKPGDGDAQTLGPAAKPETSNDAEQKAHIVPGALEGTGTTAGCKEEATSSDAEHNAQTTQGALKGTDTTTQGHQEADATPKPPVSYKGLINDVQRCYQNSTYQCLSNLKGLRDHLDRLPWAQVKMQRLHQIIRCVLRTGEFRQALPRARSSL